MSRAEELLALDDEARRLSVCEFDLPLAVEAGAGTGKTATLVARIVAWCLGPGWERARAELGAQASAPGPAEIAQRAALGVLAITFTEAAASEMNRRVRQAVSLVERDELPIGLAEDQLPPRAEWPARAGALLAALERPLAHTIHGYCSRLLHAYPLEAGLAPGFAVESEREPLREAARAALESHLREGLATRPDAGLLALARAGFGPGPIFEALEELLARGARAADFEADPLAGTGPQRWTAELERALGELERELAPLAGRMGRAKTMQGVLELLPTTRAALAEADTSTLAGLEALCERLRELWSSDSLTERVGKWSAGEFGKIEQALLGERAAVLQAAAARAALELRRLVHLHPARLQAARGLLRELLTRCEQQLREQAFATPDDLLAGAHELLVRRPEILRAVRSGLRQLLIDEFQDTDPLQCALVRALVIQADGPRPGLFLVGDPKQSIYAFRRADLAAYEGFLDELDRAGGRRLTLRRNFRSTDTILREVERLLEPALQPRPAVQPAFESLVGARGEEGPAVEHWITWEAAPADGSDPADTRAATAARIEAEAVAADVLEQHERGVPLAQCAVLLRTTSRLDVLLNALRAREIPFEVAQEAGFYRRREVLDLTALVQALVDPLDHLALLGALRSPYFGVPDAALLGLWSAGLPELLERIGGPAAPELAQARELVERVAEELRAASQEGATYAGWERCAQDGLESLAQARTALRERGALALLDELELRFLPQVHEAARYLGAFRVANLERFLARLHMQLTAAGGDTRAVLHALRAAVRADDDGEPARPGGSLADALQVSTIHRAKGLEFECVWLIGTGAETRPREAPRAALRRTAQGVAWTAFGTQSPDWVEHEEARALVEAAERARTLYVALTRARQRLVISGCWPGAPDARGWETARSHAELLLGSAPIELFGSRRPELLAGAVLEHEGARYRLAPRAREEEGHARRRARPAYDLGRARRDLGRLPGLRAAAALESARPWSLPMSHEERAQDELERPAATPPDGTRDVAALCGSLVHAALERAASRPGGELEAELARALAAVAPAVLRDAQPAQADAALAEAGELCRSFARGALGRRWLELAPGCVARELPLLAPPGDTGAVGFLSGAADLVYQERGRYAVVDFKTGRAPDASASEAHLRQVRRYADALRSSLALDHLPRCEVWYLAQERIVQAS